jgi:hypothetical protein
MFIEEQKEPSLVEPEVEIIEDIDPPKENSP